MSNYADYTDEREERDKYLFVSTMVNVAQSLVMAFKDWTIEELKDLRPKAQIAEFTVTGSLLSAVQAAIRRMGDIDKYELPEAEKNLKERIRDINDGTYHDIMDARRYLEEGLYRFEGIVRDLLEYRRLLDALSDVDKENTD